MANKVLPYKSQLVGILGRDRVFFDEEVRTLYAHDLSNPPKMLDLMVKRMPGCVVVPGSTQHLRELARWATAVGMPLTPRAAGTSAYGGSVPAKAGVVVDLRNFARKIEINEDEASVTVDPGVVIMDLEEALNGKGLMLRVFPTSAPAATIGGFVAQGGVGMGSNRWGPVSSHVVAAEVVLPNGELRRFRGRELEVVTDCEGITGFITEVTLKVTKLEEKVPVLLTYDNAEKLATGVGAIRKLHVWNITFHNPTFSALREEAGGAKTVPKKKFSILAVFTKSDYDAQTDEIARAIEASGGKRLEDDMAAKDWGEIFNTLRAKKLGPSIAPGEVVFPAEHLSRFLAKVEKTFSGIEVCIEGTLINGRDVTVLAFALEDERRPEYAVGFALGMRLLDMGKELGGRAYAPGLYLAAEARRVFGGERYDRIVDFKKAVDKARIMNPGKIIGLPPRGAPPAPFTPPFLNVDRQLNMKPAKMMMGLVAPLVRYMRPGEERFARTAQQAAIAAVTGGSFGSKHAWDVYVVANSAYCGCTSALEDAIGHEGGSVQGLTTWARRFLEDKFHPTPYVAEIIAAAAEVDWPDVASCIYGVDHAAVFKDLKAQIEDDYATTLTVSDALRNRIERAKEAQASAEPEEPQAPASEAEAKPIAPAGAEKHTPSEKAPAPKKEAEASDKA